MNSKVPVVLFIISLFLNVYGIWWGLPNYYTWAIDDQTPTTPLRIASDSFRFSSHYPPFHYILLFFIYLPYLVYLYSTGGLVSPHAGFPYGFTNPLMSLTVLMVLSRLVSAIMGALTVVFVYLSVKTLYGKKAALFSSLSVAFSYIFILYSHWANLDVPYAFWFSISLYVYIKLIKTYKTRYYILLGLFTALAISTKDQIIGLFVLLPIPLLYLHFRYHFKKLGLKATLLNKKLLYCLIALVLIYIIASNVAWDFTGFKYRVNFWVSGTDTKHYVFRHAPFPPLHDTFLGQVYVFLDTVLKLKYSVGAGLLILFMIGLFYCVLNFDKYTFALLVPLFSYYLFVIARLHFLYDRWTIPIIILLAVFAGKFLSDLIKEVSIRKFVYPLIFLMFTYSFLYGLSADLTLVYDSRHSAEKWMIENIDKNSRIEVYHDMRFLPRFHALGFNNVYQAFLDYKGTSDPPVLLFKPIIDSSSLESLEKRNPDYIVLPDCCYDINLFEEERKNYFNLLLSEKAGYKIIKRFDNKIPFAPETPYLDKRENIPVVILKRV